MAFVSAMSGQDVDSKVEPVAVSTHTTAPSNGAIATVSTTFTEETTNQDVEHEGQRLDSSDSHTALRIGQLRQQLDDWTDSRGQNPAALDMEVALKQLETRLQIALQSIMSEQLQTLKDVPKQLITLTAMMNKMDVKLDTFKHHHSIPPADGHSNVHIGCQELVPLNEPAVAHEPQSVGTTRHPSITSSHLGEKAPVKSESHQSIGKLWHTINSATSKHSLEPPKVAAAPQNLMPPSMSTVSHAMPRGSVLMMNPPSKSPSLGPSFRRSQVPLRNYRADESDDDDDILSQMTVEAFPSLCVEDIQIPEASRTSQGFKRLSRLSALSWSMGKSFKMSSDHSETTVHRIIALAGVLLPNSNFRLAWDALIVLNSSLASIVLPLVLVYYKDYYVPTGLRLMFLYLFDIFWILDILLNFRTGFFRAGKLKSDQRSIALRYMKGWFSLDLLSAFPMAVFEIGSLGSIVNASLKCPRLPQIACRFAHLRAERWGDIGMPILVALMITTHLMACFWRVFTRFDGDPIDHDLEHGKYVRDMYWVSMTLTSTGYGDILPAGTATQLYAIFVMLLGCVSFGALVSACGFFARKLLDNEAETSISELTRFMVRRDVPPELQRRVQFNLRQHFRYKAATAMSPQLLQSLSPAMQRELCLAILSNTVLNFPLFRNGQRSFVAELAQAHCWSQVLTGDLVTDEGCSVQEVIFVIHGSLQAWTPLGYEDGQFDVKLDDWMRWTSEAKDSQDSISKCTEIPTGAWIGEAAIFDLQRVFTSMVVAVQECELAVLPSVEYTNIVQKYPWLWKRHKKIEQGVRDGNISLAGLKYQRVMPVKEERASLLSNSKRGSFFQWSLFHRRSASGKVSAESSYREDDEESTRRPSHENESEENRSHSQVNESQEMMRRKRMSAVNEAPYSESEETRSPFQSGHCEFHNPFAMSVVPPS